MILITIFAALLTDSAPAHAKEFNNCIIIDQWPIPKNRLSKKHSKNSKGNSVDFRFCSPANLIPNWKSSKCENPEPFKNDFSLTLGDGYGKKLGTIWKCNPKKIEEDPCVPSPGGKIETTTIEGIANGLGGGISSEENITTKLTVDNPDEYFHGDGIRFKIVGKQQVPSNCASSIHYTAQMQMKPIPPKSTSMSSYMYVAGHTKESATGSTSKYVGIELGIANGIPAVVQNPSLDKDANGKNIYSQYIGYGLLDGFRMASFESGFTKAGDLVSRFDLSPDQSHDNDLGPAAKSAEDPYRFERHHEYQFDYLFLGAAYVNGGKAVLTDDDSYLSVLNSLGTQTIECPNEAKHEYQVRFEPLNRIQSIDGALQVQQVKRASGEVDYVVMVAKNEEKRKQLLEDFRQTVAKNLTVAPK